MKKSSPAAKLITQDDVVAMINYVEMNTLCLPRGISLVLGGLSAWGQPNVLRIRKRTKSVYHLFLKEARRELRGFVFTHDMGFMSDHTAPWLHRKFRGIVSQFSDGKQPIVFNMYFRSAYGLR